MVGSVAWLRYHRLRGRMSCRMEVLVIVKV